MGHDNVVVVSSPHHLKVVTSSDREHEVPCSNYIWTVGVYGYTGIRVWNVCTILTQPDLYNLPSTTTASVVELEGELNVIYTQVVKTNLGVILDANAIVLSSRSEKSWCRNSFIPNTYSLVIYVVERSVVRECSTSALNTRNTLNALQTLDALQLCITKALNTLNALRALDALSAFDTNSAGEIDGPSGEGAVPEFAGVQECKSTCSRVVRTDGSVLDVGSVVRDNQSLTHRVIQAGPDGDRRGSAITQCEG
jgi:hypothetical protein